MSSMVSKSTQHREGYDRYSAPLSPSIPERHPPPPVVHTYSSRLISFIGSAHAAAASKSEGPARVLILQTSGSLLTMPPTFSWAWKASLLLSTC